MGRRGWLGAVSGCVAMFAFGCAAPQPQSTASAASVLTIDPRFEDDARPLALTGFDAPSETQDWRVGDQILAGLLLRNGEKETLRYVRITALTPTITAGKQIVLCPPGCECEKPAEDAIIVRHPDGKWEWDEPRTIHTLNFEGSSTITLDDGTTTVKRFESLSVFLAVDVYDESGALLDTTVTCGIELRLRTGMYSNCEYWLDLAQRSGGSREAAEAEFKRDRNPMITHLHAFLNTIAALRDTIWGCECLAPLLGETMPKPSLLSIISHGGVNFATNLAWPVSEATFPHAAKACGEPLVAVPLTVLLNDVPSMNATLYVAPSRPPIQLVAGVVAMDFVHSTDPSRQLSVRLLAARRGSVTDGDDGRVGE